MNKRTVSVMVTTYSVVHERFLHDLQAWTRGDMGPGGLPTVVSPAGDVCSVLDSKVLVGAIRAKLGMQSISGEGARIISAT